MDSATLPNGSPPTAEQAVALKNKGNAAYAKHDWDTAIEMYSKAIASNPDEPTFWANRAQVPASGASLGMIA